MMKKTLLLLLCIFFGCYSAQNSNRTITKESIDREIVLGKKKAIDHNEAITTFLEINKNAESINYKKGILESTMVLMAKYFDVGNFKKVIELSDKAEKLAAEAEDNIHLSNTYRLKASALTELGFNEQSIIDFKKSLDIAGKIESENDKHYLNALIYSGIGTYYAHIDAPIDTIFLYEKKSMESTMKIQENKDFINKKYHNLALSYMNLGMMSVHINKTKDAEMYLSKSLEICRNNKYSMNKNLEITILNEFAWFYYDQKMYKEATVYAAQAEALEKGMSTPYIRRDIYEVYFKSFVELGDKKDSQKYMNLYTKLNDSLVNTEKKTINTPVKQIVNEQGKIHNEDIKKIIFIVCAMIIALLLAGWFFWKRNQNLLHKKYKAIIDTIESTNKTPQIAKIIPIESTPDKNIGITDDTVNAILLKLNKFEKSQKFIRKDLTLTSIANELNTNTRYLSEIIKQHKGKNFNNYLNSLRIEYITNKLYENAVYREYKISYLAEESGFSSRVVFAKIFKQETGVTPSYFIESLKKDFAEQQVAL
ncbi:helix-turn-helix domain-containing protein [Chryseobacterium wangxinyae]|uniref:helix-turn-helix domain-containing protein n=1 Tax=Chryseobacterium sp. CY353 TaxID=2997334 RepID=UPI00226E1D9B|nr:helix-turn-helix domain-containing protein [Chryseobacterium sp. CY353]MCY0969705.1 helix-turn-helix domain-containing protein [Chryseobacterium sp. CY353]